MMMQQRKQVLAEARSWLGTPYHHHANLKGVGVDCAQFILEVFVECGLVTRFDAGHYNHDWHLHRGEEKYLEQVEAYAHRVDAIESPLEDRHGFYALPGDILMFRVGRVFSHGAIVTTWPNIIHSYFPSRMVEEVSIMGTPMAVRPMRVYSYWGTPE